MRYTMSLKMLYENTVKISTPDGNASIVICTKEEVVRLNSNNIWLEKGPRWSIAGMCHQMCEITFSVRLRGLRRQLLTGIERG
jgi:hypothetical protein